MCAFYVIALRSLAIGAFVLGSIFCVLVIGREWDRAGRFQGKLDVPWMGVAIHTLMFYGATLVNLRYPLDKIPLLGLLVSPDGSQVWGAFVGVQFGVTFFAVYLLKYLWGQMWTRYP